VVDEQSVTDHVTELNASHFDELDEEHGVNVDESVSCNSVDVAQEEMINSQTTTAMVDETAAILDNLNKQHPRKEMQKYVDAAERDYGYLQSLLKGNDVELAAVVCEQLARVRAHVTAVQQRPQLPEVSHFEPGNKKATTQRSQRYFCSTKKHRKRKPELTLSKPTVREKNFLLQSLDGTVEIVSTCATDTDHDYHVRPSDLVTFEHAY
jgi:hypothetical protein